MIYEKEKIDFSPKEDQNKQLSDEEINSKYVLGEVRIITEQARYPLDTINMMIDSKKYKLNPDFQRRHRWDTTKKARLIESFIMNVPIPPIFLYEDEYSHYEVMDGLQRLTAIYQYYSNEYPLENLEYWEELNGKYYSELPTKIKQGVDRRYLSSIILLQETAKDKKDAEEMKQLVFERINNGGIKLEGQESRNALYNGNMNQLCINLSENLYLRKCIGIPTDDQYDDIKEYETELSQNEIYRKMDDVEFVLRFFAMRQLEGYQKRNLKEFLDYYMKEANLFELDLLEKLADDFEETIKLAYELFGDKAFFLWRIRKGNWNWYRRATTTVYDPMMQVLVDFIDRKELMISMRHEIKKSLIEFYESQYTEFEGRNNDKSNIEKRIQLFKDFFNGCVGD